MKPRKKGKQFEISYRCPGYTKPFFELFPTYEEANLRIAQIEYERSLGVFQPPKLIANKERHVQKKYITVGELLDEYVKVYGLNHWGDSYLSNNRHRIEHYIKPYLGNVAVKDLTTHDLDIFFDALQDKPAVTLKGHKKNDVTISPSVIEKVFDLLRSALNQAVTWGYIRTNPILTVTPPKYKSKERDVWTSAQAIDAMELCDDDILRLAILLALGCSLRIGEILGLTWDCVRNSDEEIEKATARIMVNKELKRCQKDSLAALASRGHSDVILTFPEQKKNGTTTSLVLKSPKTDSSVRMVFLPKTVALELQRAKEKQDEQKHQLGSDYNDFNLVIAHGDGRPYEERLISKMLKKFIEENKLQPVVFHSLRHCSATMKLRIGGGNIKAVQGDTGHSQARMVTDLYTHSEDEDRRQLAQKVENDFFRRVQSNEDVSQNSDIKNALQLLNDNPAIATLLIAAMQK